MGTGGGGIGSDSVGKGLEGDGGCITKTAAKTGSVNRHSAQISGYAPVSCVRTFDSLLSSLIFSLNNELVIFLTVRLRLTVTSSLAAVASSLNFSTFASSSIDPLKPFEVSEVVEVFHPDEGVGEERSEGE